MYTYREDRLQVSYLPTYLGSYLHRYSKKNRMYYTIYRKVRETRPLHERERLDGVFCLVRPTILAEHVSKPKDQDQATTNSDHRLPSAVKLSTRVTVEETPSNCIPDIPATVPLALRRCIGMCRAGRVGPLPQSKSDPRKSISGWSSSLAINLPSINRHNKLAYLRITNPGETLKTRASGVF